MILPSRTLMVLSIACAVVFSVYVLLVLTTVYFASYKTELATDIRAQEARMVTLETEYYAAVGRLTASDPETHGFVSPTQVRYVSAGGAPVFTRAGE